MADFLSTLVAAMLGVMLLAVGFAYLTADPAVKTYCDVISTNPVDQTGCTIRLTLNP